MKMSIWSCLKLEQLSASYKKIIVIGDFNLFSCSSEVTNYFEYFQSFCGFAQSNKVDNCNNRSLDLVLSSFDEENCVRVRAAGCCLVSVDEYHPPLEVTVTTSSITTGSNKMMKPVKYYYYFFICTLMITLMLQFMDLVNVLVYEKIFFELVVIYVAGLGLQLYVLTLLRSLMKKLEVDEPHDRENQLHEIVNSQGKVEFKGICNPNNIPAEV